MDELTNLIAQPYGDRRDWIAQVTQAAREIAGCSDEQVDDLLDGLLKIQLEAVAPAVDSARPTMLTRPDFCLAAQAVFAELAQRESQLLAAAREGKPSALGGGDATNEHAWDSHRTHLVAQLYRLLPPEHDVRNHAMHWLAFAQQPLAMELWSDLLCDDPPESRLGITLTFAPLMQPACAPSADVLDKLLNNSMSQPHVASAVFDLFNYYYRTQQLDQHPAASRCSELTGLLEQLTIQLGKVESGKFPAGMSPHQVNQLVSDSVALIVALCDLMALLDYRDAIDTLRQTMGLKHRRVQTEAASALARLEDDAGRQALIALANEPVARLRVLAYAEELGLKDEISLELQGEIAIAESQLAIWLSEPEQMGLSPSSMQLLDNREFYWPSYEHPLQCFLFKFTYGSGERVYSNVGICGPLTHAFAADIKDLELEDMYGAFAGWQTVHQEIFQMTPVQAERNFSNEYRRLTHTLKNVDLPAVQVQSIGSFFDRLVLIATGEQDGQPGTMVCDAEEAQWIGAGDEKAPIDWQMAYAIWRGRELLASFNPSHTA